MSCGAVRSQKHKQHISPIEGLIPFFFPTAIFFPLDMRRSKQALLGTAASLHLKRLPNKQRPGPTDGSRYTPTAIHLTVSRLESYCCFSELLAHTKQQRADQQIRQDIAIIRLRDHGVGVASVGWALHASAPHGLRSDQKSSLHLQLRFSWVASTPALLLLLLIVFSCHVGYEIFTPTRCSSTHPKKSGRNG